jgi:peptide/nickel transport system substrate-binding protein
MWFTCEQVGVWNWMRWCSSEYDDLHQKALTTLDEDQRGEFYIEMEKLWDEAVHTVWVTHAPVAFVNSTRIEPALYPNLATLLPIHEFRLAE